MKLLEAKTFPKIKFNSSGKILHINAVARRSFSTLDLGQSIFEIIDAGTLRKLSMYSKRMELVKISSAEYPTVAVKIDGKSRTKSIEATFIPFDTPDNSQDSVICLYSKKSLPSSNTCIDICEVARYTLDELLLRKELLDLRISLEALEPFFVKLGAPQAELLILTTVIALAEISPNSTIELKIENSELEIGVDHHRISSLSSLIELLTLYPQLASKILLLDALCEDEFITARVRALNGKLKIVYNIPTGSKNELIVKTSPTTAKERITAFIDTLSPKR